MSVETNNEGLFTRPESPQKSDVKRLAKDSEERTMIMIENMTEWFVDNFNLFHSKESKGQKYNVEHKQKTMTNGVVLNILSNEEAKSVRSFSEEDEEEILIIMERDI